MRTWTNDFRGSRVEKRDSGNPRPNYEVGQNASNRRRRPVRLADPLLFGLALVASVLGLIFVFDSGYARSMAAGKGMIPREFLLQIVFVLGAAAVGWACSRIRLQTWEALARPGWILNLVLLTGVLFVGLEMNGASRWFKVGPITIQPAEFAKVAVVLYLAAVFANRKAWPKSIKVPRAFALRADSIWIPKMKRALPALWVLLCLVLIELEPDLGTGFIVATTAFALFWAGGVSRRSLAWCVGLAGFALFMIIQLQPYRLERITSHADRWNPANVDGIAYQTVQSELAMASGGLIGVGMGVGRAKYVMPAATTDFIAATIGEEFGFLGWAAVAGVLGLITWRLVTNAQRAPTSFGQLVLIGFAAWIGVQTVVNLMMANGTMPAIGIPLPFISSGGSSLVALWMAVGISQAALAPAPMKSRQEAEAPVEVGRPVARGSLTWR